jgi:2-methylcitrate dehydratase PrpD
MSSVSKGISRQCADFVKGLSFADLDRDTVSVTKKCIIDWLGCVLGGSSTPAAGIIESVVSDMGGKKQATLIGDFERATALQASMVNAYNCHILEMDDVHKSSIVHPAAPVISSVFALGEYLGSSGKELIEAIVAGYDVMIRIGEAVTPSHYTIWHSTATCGTFGAAAATAKLLDLNEIQTLYSIGNAGSQAAGLWEFASDKAMTKYLHCGKAAYNGFLSSLMSKKGFTGATRILEGDRGFFKAYSKEKDFEKSFEDMGDNYRINQTVYKPYASCRHTHGPINGILEIMQSNDISYQEVERVDVETYDTVLKLAGNTDFSTPPAARFSISYCLACALIFGKVGVGQFDEEVLKDPRIPEVIARINVQTTEEMNSLYPGKWASKVLLKTKKGDKFNTFVEYPKGDPENTLDEKEIKNKFLELSTLKISEKQAETLFNRCKNIDNIKDTSAFFRNI